MPRLTAIAALSLSLALVRPAGSAAPSDLNAAESALLAAAQTLERISDEGYENYRKNMREKDADVFRKMKTRRGALTIVYHTLAACKHQKALSRPELSEEDREKARRELARLKEKRLALDPVSLEVSDSYGVLAGLQGASAELVGDQYENAGLEESETRNQLAALSTQLANPNMSEAQKASLDLKMADLYENMALEIAPVETATDEGGGTPAAESPEETVADAQAALTAEQIYRKAAPAVVVLACIQGGKTSFGTGTVINKEGYIVTNSHVVVSAEKPFERVLVFFKPARVTGDMDKDLANPREAKVLRFDRELDLALLKLSDKPGNLAVLPLGDSSRVEPGEPVVAIGHPEQGGLWTLTKGVVSTVKADVGGIPGKDVFQTDASINRGNSGGPLIDRRGVQIGVNSLVARQSPKDGMTITSVNFSLQSNIVKKWLSKTSGLKYAQAADEERVSDDEVTAAAEEDVPAADDQVAAADSDPGEPVSEPAERERVADAAPAPRPKILTPAKPFNIQDLLAREIEKMNSLEGEMRREIEKRGARLNEPPRKK